METKICIKCNEEQPIDNFHPRGDTGKRRNECKTCRCSRDKLYRAENQPKIKARVKEKYQANAEENKLKAKLFYQKNKEKIKSRTNAYYHKNKDSLLAAALARQKVKLKEDPIFKLKRRLRARMYDAVKKQKIPKIGKLNEYVGTDDFNKVKDLLESTFQQGMSWENHGSVWDIDHVVPLSVAKTPEHLHLLSHYTNLQALPSSENRTKKRDHFNPSVDLSIKLCKKSDVNHSMLGVDLLPDAEEFEGYFLNNGTLVAAYRLDGSCIGAMFFCASPD